MRGTPILRWWVALNLAASGLAWGVLAIIIRPDVRPLWLLRRVFSVALGIAMLSCAYLLAVRWRSRGIMREQPDARLGFKDQSFVSMGDGFLVFSIASFLFNLFLVLFRRYDFSPTFDVIHFIPTLITNTVWEGLISRSGGSLILFFSSVVMFDGVVGALAGMVMSPLRLIPRSRIGIVVLDLLLFCGFELALAKWFMFRC